MRRSSWVFEACVAGVGALVAVSGGCFRIGDDPGGNTDGDVDSGTSVADTTVTGSSTTSSAGLTSDTMTDSGSESSSACSASDGAVDPACGPAAPFCLAGQCVGCDAVDPGACGNADPAAPVCDPTTGLCTACDEHDACETGACERSSGTCVATENRLWVDSTANCGLATGREQAPLCTIADALSVVGTQPGSEPWAIFVAGAAAAYEESLSASGDHPIAVIGPTSGLSARIEVDDGTALSVSTATSLSRLVIRGEVRSVAAFGGPVWIDDCELRGLGFGTGLDLGSSAVVRRSRFEEGTVAIVVHEDAQLVVEDSSVTKFLQGMTIAAGAQVRFERSYMFTTYVDGGIAVDGGSLQIIGSMLSDNIYNFGDVRAINGSEVEVVYSTLATGFECDGGTISIRNSAVLDFACPSASVDFSAVEGGAGQGEGNVEITPKNLPGTFVSGSDFHTVVGSILEGVARWRAGDPLVDIDGDPRVGRPGAADYAGADVP